MTKTSTGNLNSNNHIGRHSIPSNTPAFDERSLRHWMRHQNNIAIALSGGIDSSLLAIIAQQELSSQRVLAITGVSASLAEAQLQQCIHICLRFNIPHQTVQTRELEMEKYQQNNPDRCFHCKHELYSQLRSVLKTSRAADTWIIIDGTHTDDLKGHRPGHQAALAHNIHSPWLELHATKKDIRALADKLGLPQARQPSSPCLSSRIAYGLRVTPTRLQQIERAEAFIHTLGIAQVRVRLHHNITRIEVPIENISILMEHRQNIVAQFAQLGLACVTLDMAGYRPGSLLNILHASE